MDIASLKRVAKRAYIRVETGEQAVLAAELSAVMAYISSMPSAENHQKTIAKTAPLRPDEAVPGLLRDEILAAAPDSNGGLFRVSLVIKEGGN